MQFVYGWLVGAVMGFVGAWIWKSHLVHEAIKANQLMAAAAQKAVTKL